MSRAALALLALALAPGLARAADDQLSGPAKVRGPDTLVIAGARVRLAGVVPPAENVLCAASSGAGPCVDAAATALAELVASGTVTCVKQYRLGHGYFRGRCLTESGVDPAEALLARGLLRPDPAGAPANYLAAAAAARDARNGLWGS